MKTNIIGHNCFFNITGFKYKIKNDHIMTDIATKEQCQAIQYRKKPEPVKSVYICKPNS